MQFNFIRIAQIQNNRRLDGHINPAVVRLLGASSLALELCTGWVSWEARCLKVNMFATFYIPPGCQTPGGRCHLIWTAGFRRHSYIIQSDLLPPNFVMTSFLPD